jgi:hypothetical protein
MHALTWGGSDAQSTGGRPRARGGRAGLALSCGLCKAEAGRGSGCLIVLRRVRGAGRGRSMSAPLNATGAVESFGGDEAEAALEPGQAKDALHHPRSGNEAQGAAVAVRKRVCVEEGAQPSAVHKAEPAQIDNQVGLARAFALHDSGQLADG